MSYGHSFVFVRTNAGCGQFCAAEHVKSLLSRSVIAANRFVESFGSVPLHHTVAAIISVISGMLIKQYFLKKLTRVLERIVDKSITWNVGTVHCAKKLLDIFVKHYLFPKLIICIMLLLVGSLLRTI